MRGGYNDADFLIGAFNSIEGAVDLAKGDFRGTELAFYLDDTYKVTPNLTAPSACAGNSLHPSS